MSEVSHTKHDDHNTVCAGWTALALCSCEPRKVEAQDCLVEKLKRLMLEDGLDHPCEEPCDRMVRGRSSHHNPASGVSIKLNSDVASSAGR